MILSSAIRSRRPAGFIGMWQTRLCHAMHEQTAMLRAADSGSYAGDRHWAAAGKCSCCRPSPIAVSLSAYNSMSWMIIYAVIIVAHRSTVTALITPICVKYRPSLPIKYRPGRMPRRSTSHRHCLVQSISVAAILFKPLSHNWNK